MNTMATNMNTNAGYAEVSTDKLRADLGVLAADMEKLLEATATQTGHRMTRIRVRAEESLRAAKVRAAELQDSALARGRAVGRATDDYVHARPWEFMAVSAATGLLLGFWLTRSGDSSA